MSERTTINVELRDSISSSQFSPEFVKEILRHPGCEKLLLCYQCGACAGSCPVGKITNSYRPRQIIRKASLGLKKDLFKDGSIWLCASCYTCQERCSQGVEIADIMLAIRNIAVREGYVPKTFVDRASMLIENARLVEISTSTERQRSMLGLPNILETSKSEVKEIAAITGFDKLIEKLKR